MTGMKSKLEKLHKQLDKILENIITEHQQKQIRAKEGRAVVEEEDLVDVLLRVQQSSILEIELTTRNIKAVILVSKLMQQDSQFLNLPEYVFPEYRLQSSNYLHTIFLLHVLMFTSNNYYHMLKTCKMF